MQHVVNMDPDEQQAAAMASPAKDGAKRTRTVQKLTNGDRKWICQRKMSHPDERINDMQQAFRNERNPDVELKSGTVSGIIKQTDKWLSINDDQETGTRTRSSKEPELEAALYAWRSEQLAQNEKVRDEDLREKARYLAAVMGINTDRQDKGLSFSSGWLDRFKKRNAIQQSRYNRRPRKGEDVVPPPADINMEPGAGPAMMNGSSLMTGVSGFGGNIPALSHIAPVAHDRFAVAHPNGIPQPDQAAAHGQHPQHQDVQASVPPPSSEVPGIPGGRGLPGAADVPTAYAAPSPLASQAVPPPSRVSAVAAALPTAASLPVPALGGVPLPPPAPPSAPDADAQAPQVLPVPQMMLPPSEHAGASAAAPPIVPPPLGVPPPPVHGDAPVYAQPAPLHMCALASAQTDQRLCADRSASSTEADASRAYTRLSLRSKKTFQLCCDRGTAVVCCEYSLAQA